MRLRPISAVLAVSTFRPGSPISNVAGELWEPWANSSSAVGARSIRCTVALATIHEGRSLSTLKLMLLGMKRATAAAAPDCPVAAAGSAENAGRAVETNRLDATGQQRAQRVAQPQLVEEIGRAPVGTGGAEQAAGIARGVDLLVIELRADRTDQGAERRGQRHELDFGLGLLRVIVERRANAVLARFVKSQLVVLVFYSPQPEAHDIDGGRLRTKLALAGDLGLLQVDAAVVLGAFARSGCDRGW